MNKVILIGRLCNEPELKYVGENNSAVTRFTIAVNRKYKNSNGEYDVDFIDCELWRKQAETFCKYVTRGNLVGIEGNLVLDKYVSASGENIKKVTVRCVSFDFLTPKQKNNANNVINSDSVFNNEDCLESEFSECEIPF